MSENIRDTDKAILRKAMDMVVKSPRSMADMQEDIRSFLRNAALPVSRELPDDLRAPLHSLQADLDYLVARIRVEDDEVCGMLKDSIRERLSQIEEASYRLAHTPSIEQASS